MKSFLISILSITTSSVVAKPDVEYFSGAASKDFSRIVGGEDISPGDYPYFVDFGFCGGALIAPDLILTAAHCEDVTNEQVHIGAYETDKLTGGSQERYCEDWIAHPSFDVENFFDLDLALCKLNKPVTIDESRIRLELNEDDTVPSGGEDLIVIGLGALESDGDFPDIVQEVTVPEVNNSVCNQIDNFLYLDIINDNKLCAGFLGEGKKDSCQGDSGGPLIRRTTNPDGSIVDTHVGIVSYGKGCAKPKFPGVYARTSAGLSWIKDTACNTLQSVASFCDEVVVAPSLPCPGPELTYTVATASNPSAVGTRLQERGRTIFLRYYRISDYVNEHKVCLKPNTEYKWAIQGGGNCPDDGLCGWFSLSLDGEVIFVGSGRDYSFSDFYDFRTPEALSTASPTSAPTTGPTKRPTTEPTSAPTASPTSPPTQVPTQTPTSPPTKKKKITKSSKKKEKSSKSSTKKSKTEKSQK